MLINRTEFRNTLSFEGASVEVAHDNRSASKTNGQIRVRTGLGSHSWKLDTFGTVASTWVDTIEESRVAYKVQVSELKASGFERVSA